MKFRVEEVSPLERKLNVEVPVEVIVQSYTKVFKEIQKQAQIKGFRKGKAPIKVIRTMYKDRVQEDVVKDVIQTGFFQAIQEHKLDPIGEPNFEFEQILEDKSFTFSAAFEVRPEVKVKSYKELPVVREKLVVDAAKVADILTNLQKGQAESVAVFEDRAVRMGDVAVLDFDGFVNGEALEGGSAQNHELELGSQSFIEGFEEGLVGMKIGDAREIPLKFPEVYHAAHLAGQPVTFKVKLNGIKAKKVPELNDDFAKSLDPKFKTLDDLKSEIENDLKQNEMRRIDEDTRSRLLKKLVEINPVLVPPSMLANQKQMLIEDFGRRMRSQGMTEEQFKEYQVKWDQDFTNTASQMIQSSFLLSEIAADNKITASREDLQKKIQEFADRSQIDVARVQEFYNQPEQMNRLRFQVIEEKVVSLLLETAVVTEKDAKDIADLQQESI